MPCARSDRRTYRPETNAEEFDDIAGAGRRRTVTEKVATGAEDIVGSAAVSTGTVVPQDDAGDVFSLCSRRRRQAETRREATQSYVRHDRAGRSSYNDGYLTSCAVVRRLHINLARTHVHQISGLTVDVPARERGKSPFHEAVSEARLLP